MAIPGGTESLRQRAGMVTGNRAVFTADGEVCSGATVITAVTNQTGITGATGAAVMLGLAATITPNAGGTVMVFVTGDIICGTIGDGATLQLSYGTGSAPANNGTLAGTQVAKAVTFLASTVAGRVPLTMMAAITGLTSGTAYWLDLAVENLTGGTTTVANVTVTAVEL
jgi:hypothetical protein